MLALALPSDCGYDLAALDADATNEAPIPGAIRNPAAANDELEILGPRDRSDLNKQEPQFHRRNMSSALGSGRLLQPVGQRNAGTDAEWPRRGVGKWCGSRAPRTIGLAFEYPGRTNILTHFRPGVQDQRYRRSLSHH